MIWNDKSTLCRVAAHDCNVVTHNENPGSAVFSTSSDKKSNLLKIVVLLLDLQTQRFEIMQLEFDSAKALVSDVLTQISVTSWT